MLHTCWINAIGVVLTFRRLWRNQMWLLQSFPWRGCPANKRRWPNAGVMMARRLRRRPIISPALGARLLIAGWWRVFWRSGVGQLLLAISVALRRLPGLALASLSQSMLAPCSWRDYARRNQCVACGLRPVLIVPRRVTPPADTLLITRSHSPVEDGAHPRSGPPLLPCPVHLRAGTHAHEKRSHN